MGRNAGLWLPDMDDNSQWLCIFGMGGQLAVYYPDKDVILVTTADAQGRQGGVQLIYDTFYEEVYSHIDTCTDNGDYKEFQKFENSRQLLVEPGEYSSDLVSKINGQNYEFGTNPCGVTDIKLTFNGDEGTFFYTNATGNHELHFGLGKNVFQNFLIIISNVVQAQLSEQTIIFLSKCRLLIVPSAICIYH